MSPTVDPSVAFFISISGVPLCNRQQSRVGPSGSYRPQTLRFGSATAGRGLCSARIRAHEESIVATSTLHDYSKTTTACWVRILDHRPTPFVGFGILRGMGALLDPEVDAAEDQDDRDRGPRIRCPLCNWSPSSRDRWLCTCGHSWNTFDTGGVCPACLFQWASTQCLACGRWSPHSAWYEQ